MIDVERCQQCGLERPSGVTSCPRCGAAYAFAVDPSRLLLLLRATTGEMAGHEWQITQPETIIGRSHTCDVPLPHDSVSRHHARISRTAHGFMVEDLGSQNWTFVNDQRVAVPHLLADGDRLIIGKVPLDVELLEVAEQEALPEPFERPGATIMVDVGAALAELPLPHLDDPPTERYVPSPSPVQEPLAAPAPMAVLEVAPEQPPPAASLASLLQRLAAAEAQFTAAGGREALVKLLNEARATAANPTDVRQLMLLGELAGPAVALLEAELALADLLWSGP